MTYKARFVHGSRSLNLDAGEFDLYQDFIFPGADESLNVSTPNVGSMSGGSVISKTPQDRWWAWSVRIMGTTIAQTHMAARRLSMWLSQAVEDKTDKVYFEYTPSYNVPAPIWGQHGAPYRFEVKAAIVDMDGSYYVADIPSKALILPVSLLVAPYALGARQILAQAKGAVFEDTGGTADGLSRGTIINGGITNLVVNPSFETNTTGWAGSGGAIERTTDQAWAGSYGLRLTVSTTNTLAVAALANATTGAPLTQQNYVASVRVYIPAQMVGKAVSLTIWESGGASAAEATVTKSLTPSVAGWQYMFATGTVKKADRTALAVYLGITASATTPAGSWVIWDAVQLVGPDVFNIYPYIDGDKIGCVWNGDGTAHANTSTSTGGYCRIPVTSSNYFDMKQGSICAVMKMPYANTDVPSGNNNRVFYTDTALRVMFYETSDVFTIHDNTSSTDVAASWSAGGIIVVHATWGPAGMKVYFNATASAAATYTNPGAAAYCYIGSNASSPPTERILATFLDFSVWDVPLTATEVAADYAEIRAHIDGGDGEGQRLSSIPYMWTKDGDNQVDNYYDATHNHYAIINGIPGTTEAYTEIEGTPSAAFSGIHLSNFTTKRYFSPSIFFKDSSGTDDASAVGGKAHVTSTDQSAAELSEAGMSWTKSAYPEFSAMPFYILTRMKAASSVYARIQSYVSSATYGINITTDYSRPVAIGSSSYYILRTIAGMTQKNYSGYDTDTEEVEVYGFITSGTVNVSLDYAVMFPRPYLYCYGYAITKFMLKDNTITKITGGAAVGMIEVLKPIGDSIELSPNRYNILQSLMGCEDSDATLTTTLTYVIYATPRYRLV